MTNSDETIREKLRQLAPIYRGWPAAKQKEWFKGQAPQVQRALRYCWEFVGRSAQQPPAQQHYLQLIMAGRGFGKTRSLTERVRHWSRTNPGCIIHVVAPTHDDCVKVILKGPSGLLNVCPPEELSPDAVNFGNLTVQLANGTTILLFSAESPQRLRGPECNFLAMDEVAAVAAPNLDEVYSNAELGLRRGSNPQMLLTTTPKPIALLKRLVKMAVPTEKGQDAEVLLTRGTTFDNPSISWAARMRYKLQAGTRARQELYGELLENVEGALWTLQDMDACRVSEAPELRTCVVGVDPAITGNEGSDETGIIVAGAARNDHLYVLADASLRGKPDQWAARVAQAYRQFNCAAVIAESNQGGAMVESVIHAVDPNIRIILVHASVGKIPRAEPVSTHYKLGFVHHVGDFTALEDQMTTYSQGTKESPDRLDALVWAITHLTGGSHHGVLAYWDKLIAAGKEKLLAPVDRLDANSAQPAPWPELSVFGRTPTLTKQPPKHTAPVAAALDPCPECGATGRAATAFAKTCGKCGHKEILLDNVRVSTTMGNYKSYK